MGDEYKCYADAAKIAGLELPEPKDASVRVKHRTFGPGSGNITRESGEAVDIYYNAADKKPIQQVTFEASRDEAGNRTDTIVARNGFRGASVGIAKSDGTATTTRDGDAPRITQPKNISAAVTQAMLCR